MQCKWELIQTVQYSIYIFLLAIAGRCGRNRMVVDLQYPQCDAGRADAYPNPFYVD